MSSPIAFPHEYSRLHSTSYAQENGSMVLYDDGSGQVVEYDLITNSSTLDMETDVSQFLRDKKASIDASQTQTASIPSPEPSTTHNMKTDYELQQADVDTSMDHALPPRTRKQRDTSCITYTRVLDRRVVPRARASLPAALRLLGARVLTRRRLPAHALFGPVQGVHREVTAAEATQLRLAAEAEGGVVFLVADPERGTTAHIDVSDENTSNWLRYVPLGGPGAATLRLQQAGRELYAVSERALPRGAPLTLAYSPAYLTTHFAQENASFEDGVDSAVAMTEADADWQCYECAALYRTSAELQAHLAVHDPPTSDCGGVAGRGRPPGRRKLPRCPHCRRAFTKPFWLKRHIETHHRPPHPTLPNNEEGATSCETRGAGAGAAGARGRGRLACALCGAAARTRTQHRVHTDTHRDADALFRCTHCYKKFETYPTVRQHIRAQHGDARYACPRCRATFTRAAAFNSHMLRYTDERKFICECGKQFKRKDKLRAHMKAKHPDGVVEQMSSSNKDVSGMPYKCRLCRIGFKRRGMLVNHVVRRHPELSPGALPELARPVLRPRRDYHCPRCPRVYSVAAKRKEHFLRHHPGEAAPPARGAWARERAPAACAPHACPAPACRRQYATRGRLNRHLREAHPPHASSALAAAVEAVEPAPEIPTAYHEAPTILLLADLAADQNSALLCPQGDGVMDVDGVMLTELSGAETYAAEALAYLLHRPHTHPHLQPPPPDPRDASQALGFDTHPTSVGVTEFYSK